MEAIDAWLDTRWDIPSLLLVVSIGYQSKPMENDGEAIGSILLSNRPTRDIPCTTRFHRPEKVTLTICRTAYHKPYSGGTSLLKR